MSIAKYANPNRSEQLPSFEGAVERTWKGGIELEHKAAELAIFAVDTKHIDNFDSSDRGVKVGAHRCKSSPPISK